MKKMLAIIFVLLCLFATKQNNFFQHFELPQDTIYYLYTNTMFDGEDGVCVGGSYIVRSSKPIEWGNRKIYGQSICFSGSIDDFNEIIEKLDIKYTYENVDDIVIISGYSSSINNIFTSSNTKRNIQMAYNKGQISIGVPMILGSY